MPKISRELSALEVGRLRKEGDHAVGGVPGLYLQVMGGSRAWILRFSLDGRRPQMGLGSFPAVPLAAAREKARAARELIARGINPIHERDEQKQVAAATRARALTFKQACEKYIAAKESEWRNPKHRQQWENTLETYAEPVLGHMDVAAIGQDEILQVLDPIWRTKTETAKRVRGRIESVLDWATTRRHRKGENPARWRGHLDHLLPKPSKIMKVEHYRAVSVADAPMAVARIDASKGMGARALMFQLLTASRSGAVRAAEWKEIDLEAGQWDAPAEHMKGNKAHRVPLSRQAILLLQALPRFEHCDLIFPSLRLTPLSDMALLLVMRRLKIEAVPHGFRSTFRDWVSEHTNYPGDMAEQALAHTIESKVEAAYRRGDMLAKRVAMMQDWADFCMPQPLAPTSKG